VYPEFTISIFEFGSSALALHGNIGIESKIPLYMEVHDPTGALNIKTDKTNKTDKPGFYQGCIQINETGVFQRHQ
jgi:hypothetical protein